MSKTSSSAVVSVTCVKAVQILKVWKSGTVYRFFRDGKSLEATVYKDGDWAKIRSAKHLYELYNGLAACSREVLAGYFAKVGITKVESRIFYDYEDACAKGLDDVLTSITTWQEDGSIHFREYSFYKHGA